MKTEIAIRNGSGWNRYEALKALTLPRGTKGLLKVNKVAVLKIEPTDPEKPFGFKASFCDKEGELIYALVFDQNDTANRVRESVACALETGLDVCLKNLAKKREQQENERLEKIKKDKEAREKGFSNYAAMVHAKYLEELNARAVEEGFNSHSERAHFESCWTAGQAMHVIFEKLDNAKQRLSASQKGSQLQQDLEKHIAKLTARV